MTKFEINKTFPGTEHKQTVEAQSYAVEGGYFVFYTNGGATKVLTIESRLVYTVDEVSTS